MYVAGPGPVPQYNSRLTLRVVFTCLCAAAGGLLFGYDNGVTGGVTAAPEFLRKFFPTVYRAVESGAGANDPYCKYDNQGLQAFTSSLFLAGMVASLPAAWTTRHLGRRVSILIAGVSYIIGVVLVTAAVHIAMLILGRIFLGIGVGFANQAVTLYNSEVAPPHYRGAMNILFQQAVTIGILIAQLINYGVRNWQHGWRLSLGIAGIPAVVVFLGGLFLPETPNSLIERGHYDKGRTVLRKLRGVQDIDEEFNDIKAASDVSNQIKHPWRSIIKKPYWHALTLSVLMPFFQQFTGINAIIFYAPQLFNSLGSGADSALLSTVIIGAVNVGCTLVAVFGVDKFGRKPLLIEAGVQMFAAEVAIAIILAITFHTAELADGPALAVIILVCVFISCFAWSWGPLGWLIPSEVLPLEARSAGQSINVCVNLLFTFIIGQCFLSMLCAMRWGIFLFFAGWVLIMTLFAIFFIPETKGLPIEDVMLAFRHHWFWKHTVDLSRMPTIAVPGKTDGAPKAPVRDAPANLAGHGNTRGVADSARGDTYPANTTSYV
jgi:sugar porter (SP) family MFS transporter